MDIQDFELNSFRSIAPGPLQGMPVTRGTTIYSSNLGAIYVVTGDGFFGGDSFDVTFTAGSNVVLIPNNVLDWEGMSIFCDSFPQGVAITGRTGVYREFTIAANAPATRIDLANFCPMNTIKIASAATVGNTPDATIHSIRRQATADILTEPTPVVKGSLWLSYSGRELYVADDAGHFGGDHFEVTYTAGSNLVIIPNNVLVWSGLKLFCPQFPDGVLLTGKTANYQEYTIATPATVSARQRSNFGKFNVVEFAGTSPDMTVQPLRRSVDAEVITRPPFVRKGSIWLAFSGKEIYIAEQDGYFGGDHFDVTYTAGSNLVLIPNNILVWNGLKLYSEQFPEGVAITGKTANYREYTIATNATVSRVMKSNFNKFATIPTTPSTGADDFKIRATVDDGDPNAAVPYTNPVRVKAGDMYQSVDKTELYVVDVAGHYGGDNFEIQLTTGSNVVLIPNNALVWSGLKLFCPSFPAGVVITGKTGNYREYTIATNATVTRKEKANFCGVRTAAFAPFGGIGVRKVLTNANDAIYPGQYYLPSTASNLPVANTAIFLTVEQHGNTLLHSARLDSNAVTPYGRRSTDNGATYGTWQTVY